MSAYASSELHSTLELLGGVGELDLAEQAHEVAHVGIADGDTGEPIRVREAGAPGGRVAVDPSQLLESIG